MHNVTSSAHWKQRRRTQPYKLQKCLKHLKILKNNEWDTKQSQSNWLPWCQRCWFKPANEVPVVHALFNILHTKLPNQMVFNPGKLLLVHSWALGGLGNDGMSGKSAHVGNVPNKLEAESPAKEDSANSREAGQGRAEFHTKLCWYRFQSWKKERKRTVNGVKICGGEYTEMMRKDLLRSRNTYIKRLSPWHD